jgi:xanthine dehydrogenase accessory factor
MTDLDQLLPLWLNLRETGTEYVLATVVAVEGSGYRKPGARMLIAADGRRAGTISGGCLEGEVARKALWHTENGPVVRRYSTNAEDGEVPFGMGCGGVVHLLLERSATANLLLDRLTKNFAERTPLAIATILDGDWVGQRVFWPSDCGHSAVLTDRAEEAIVSDLAETILQSLACQSFEEQRSFSQTIQTEDRQVVTVRAEWCPARPALFVFGAGDDAIPLVRQARQLGWYVAVADGRSNLATRTRFPEAHDVPALPADGFPRLQLRSSDAAVVMTHSLQQDTRILRCLLQEQLAYIGVLGPHRRTSEMLLAIAQDLGVPQSRVEAQLEVWMDRLHAPMGLDLGGDTPADIALSVIAEIQQTRNRASGLPLRRVRASGTGTQAISSTFR